MSLYKPKRRNRAGELVDCSLWWSDVVVAGTRHRQSLGVRDQRAARMRESDLVRRLERQAAGLPVEDDISDASPKPLIIEYERELQRRRSSPVHVRRTIQRVTDLIGKARRLGEVSPGAIRSALDRVVAKGVSARTINGYRLALSGFYTWLVREGRWPTNPVKQVAPVQPGEKSRERRALTAEELGRLLDAAPPHRALLYRVAATTGLRRGELAALRWADVDLEAATLRVRASTSKNRREAVQPLPEGTVTALGAARNGGQIPAAPVFAAVPGTPTLRKDLAAAKIPYRTAEGVADLHALRVTYATLLARAGVSLVQAQRLMRHSDPKLTANIYTRLRLDDGHAAVARIDLTAEGPRRVGRGP